MQKVTLLGERQARVGFRFLFEGVADLCAECSVKKVCLGNLENGRLYEVSKVTKKRFPCLLHAGEAVVVEVREPPVEAALAPRSAIKDALITYSRPECQNGSCEHLQRCFPVGLLEGDRCRVVEVKDSLKCPLRGQLLSVSLQRQP